MPDAPRLINKRQKTPAVRVQVAVTRSVEALDFDTWAARYVRAVIAAEQAAHHLQEAA